MKTFRFLGIICFLGLLLRLIDLPSTMPFIGDQAWFYLSARDAILTGHFPLLGITSSVTWLHQGPLWTYLLIPALVLSGFHPVSGAVLTVFISSLTCVLCYFLGTIWFNRRTGLSAAFLFAISPLAIIYARMPYHTSPIPLFLVLFLLFFTRRRFFLANLMLGFLFQLELVTAIFWPVYIFFLLKCHYRLSFRDLSAFFLGILPFILSGPVQTGGIFIWSVYHQLIHSGTNLFSWPFYLNLIQKFYLPGIPVLSYVTAISSVAFSIFRRKIEILWLILPAGFIFLNGTSSEAYFTLLVVPLSIFTGYLLSTVFKRHLLLIFFTAWWLVNSHYLLSKNYSLDDSAYGVGLASRLSLSRQIFANSLTAVPTLTTIGPGSQFATTKDPYKYLLWWQGLTDKPLGTHWKFEINTIDQTFRVIK